MERDHFNWAKEQGFIPKWWEKIPERREDEVLAGDRTDDLGTGDQIAGQAI